MWNGWPTADTEPYLHLGPLLETTVSSDDISTIYYTRKSFLSNKGKTWTNPKSGLFKVLMETFDRPKVCEWELVAFFQKLMCYEYKLVKNHYIDATLYLLPHVTYWWFLKNDSEITNIHKEQNHTKPINKNFLRRVFEF